jgi:hypothetical protein
MTLRHARSLPRRMTPYEDSSHASGVSAYACGNDFITVRFKSGDAYRYDYKSAGRDVVDTMKRLAVSGRGLSTYISREVKENYATKFEASH